MFRIKKVFENEATTILKIAGDIPNETVESWAAEMRRLIQSSDRHLIFEVCEIACLSSRAMQRLQELLTGNVFLLNCSTMMRNRLRASGFSDHILD